jgi:hypothetical protein
LTNWLAANKDFGRQSHSGFGIAFPTNVAKGDTFLRVDTVPSKLFKFNGTNWMQVSKEQNPSYINDAYLRFVIEQLSNGHLDINDLNADEQEDIRALLEREGTPKS